MRNRGLTAGQLAGQHLFTRPLIVQLLGVTTDFGSDNFDVVDFLGKRLRGGANLVVPYSSTIVLGPGFKRHGLAPQVELKLQSLQFCEHIVSFWLIYSVALKEKGLL